MILYIFRKRNLFPEISPSRINLDKKNIEIQALYNQFDQYIKVSEGNSRQAADNSILFLLNIRFFKYSKGEKGIKSSTKDEK